MTSRLDLNEKNILVTGACGGIGSSLCTFLVSHGATVYACDINEQQLEELAAKNPAQIVPVVADITNLTDMKAKLSTIDLHAVVANAGMARGLSLESMSDEDWYYDTSLNINGTYHTVEATLNAIKKNHGGYVIIGSVNSFQYLGHPAYSAAKAALESYTRSLATEYGKYGIRANMICPGTVKTQAWAARAAKDPQVFEKLKKWYPLGRFLEPEDISAAVAFLLSGFGQNISGAIIPVDAGLSAGNRILASQLTLQDI